MHTNNNFSVIARGFFIGCLAFSLVLVLIATATRTQDNRPQDVASVPAQVSSDTGVPGPVGTAQLPVFPTISPQVPTPEPTPTILLTDPPELIDGIVVTAMTLEDERTKQPQPPTSTDLTLSEVSTVSRPQPIGQFAWAPTGDKLLFVEQSGELYLSDIDGNNATVLHKYSELDDYFQEQQPMGDTLLVRHLGDLQPEGGRAPTHMDVIKFATGEPPSIKEGPELKHPLHHLRWWSPDRASGIAHTDYEGGDLLVTLDAEGNLVDEVNVPHMYTGAVQPGGEWLVYATNGQSLKNLDLTQPKTIYLRNLKTNKLLQLTKPGEGAAVGSWSPDGEWFLVATSIGTAVVRANGKEWLIIPEGEVNAVWSPNSKFLAFSDVTGKSSDGHNVSSWEGSTYLVNLSARKVKRVNLDSQSVGKPGASGSAGAGTLLWQPRWSPNGASLAFLSFDPACPYMCSGKSPAIHRMEITTK